MVHSELSDFSKSAICMINQSSDFFPHGVRSLINNAEVHNVSVQTQVILILFTGKREASLL